MRRGSDPRPAGAPAHLQVGDVADPDLIRPRDQAIELAVGNTGERTRGAPGSVGRAYRAGPEAPPRMSRSTRRRLTLVPALRRLMDPRAAIRPAARSRTACGSAQPRS